MSTTTTPRRGRRLALAQVAMTVALWMTALPRKARLPQMLSDAARQPLLPPSGGVVPHGHGGVRVWGDEGLHTISRFAAPTQASASNDFTAQVMARLSAASSQQNAPSSPPPTPSATASQHALTPERLAIVFMTFTVSALIVLLTSFVLALVAPDLAFAALSLLVSGFVLLLTGLRTLIEMVNSAPANATVMVLLAAGLASILLLWTRWGHIIAQRGAREA